MIRQKVMKTLQESQQKLAAQRVEMQVMRARQIHHQQLQSVGAPYNPYPSSSHSNTNTHTHTDTNTYTYAGPTQVHYTPEQISYYQQQGYAVPTVPTVPPPPLPPQPPKERKNLVAMQHNSQYNLNTLLARNILRSDYFRALYDKSTFQEVVDEIYYKVEHVEPWMNAAARKPSTAFCLLYKLFTMKLTTRQMDTMLSHTDSPYIRALGFLYLRYTCPPDQLWSWCEPYLHDTEEFSPQQGAKAKHTTTIGKWLEGLLGTDLKYYGTLLPRIPKQIETANQVQLLKTKAEPEEARSSMSSTGEYGRGTIVRARYSEDGKWYDARIEEPGRKPGSYWVTYLPEEEYGNQEEVDLKSIKPLRKASKKRKVESDEELRRRVLERERNAAATSGRDYAKPIPGIKSALAVSITKRHKTEADDVSAAPQKSIDEVLKDQGRIGEIEQKAQTQAKSGNAKRNKEREELLARYGNVAQSSAKMKNKHKG